LSELIALFQLAGVGQPLLAPPPLQLKVPLARSGDEKQTITAAETRAWVRPKSGFLSFIGFFG
jgi:hypothetical protein